MSAASSVSATVIWTIKSCTLFKVEGGSRSIVLSGDCRILRVDQEDDTAIVFLGMSGQTVPLNKEVPVLRASDNHFVFPKSKTISYGLIIPMPPNTLDDIQIFATFLEEHSNMRTQGSGAGTTAEQGAAEAEAEGATSTAEKITKGARFARKGMLKGATKGAGLIRKGGAKLKGKIKKNETESKLTEAQKSKLAKARKSSAAVVKVSSMVVSGVASFTETLGIEAHQALQSSETGKKVSNSKYSGHLKTAAATSLTVYSEIWEGLLEAGEILATASGEVTADLVEHKYGEEYGEASREAGKVVANVGKIAVNASELTISGVARNTAKSTAKAGLMTEEEKEASREKTRSQKSQASTAALLLGS